MPSCCIRPYLVAIICHHRTSAVKSSMANSMFASARRVSGLVCTRRSITISTPCKHKQDGPWKLRINANEDKVPPSYLPQVACLHNQLLVCLSPASPSHTLIASGSVIIMYTIGVPHAFYGTALISFPPSFQFCKSHCFWVRLDTKDQRLDVSAAVVVIISGREQAQR